MDDLEVDTRVARSPWPWIRRASKLAILLLALGAAVAVASNRPGVLRGIAYVEQSDPAEARTLDLYLPAASESKPPLVAFVHSRFWSHADGGRRLDVAMARPLQ